MNREVMMKRYKLEYTGGCLGVIALTFLSLTGVGIPWAVCLLIDCIEIAQIPLKDLAPD
jgi:hypothetical protein